MIKSISFALKVFVSVSLASFYLFYFSNRYFLELNGKYVTVIEENHSYYIMKGIYLGLGVPQKSIKIKSSFDLNENAVGIYDTNSTDIRPMLTVAIMTWGA